MPTYNKLSDALTERIENDIRNNTRPNFGTPNSNAVRRDNTKDAPSVWRPSYARDVDKILYSPYYNRYTDKTQVFSFYKNDDISRRALHVQLVSRIARSIGSALNLNLDLIEAIALGHDIGHTPFGHAGERFLSEAYYAETGRYFNHNVHSVRVLDGIFPKLNLSLDTLNGIIAHNGEVELNRYEPLPMSSFDEFDSMVESCYVDQNNILKILPSTIEGCVMRISDIIAYLGKDRLDAEHANLAVDSGKLHDDGIGRINQEIINNLEVSIIENSYGKPYIKMDEEHFNAMKLAKQANYDLIYKNESVSKTQTEKIRPVMLKLYQRLLNDLREGNKNSPIFKHHINFVVKNRYSNGEEYLNTEHNQIVCDYIASMTDDYCKDLYDFLFPHDAVHIEYQGYFDKLYI